MSKGCSNTIGHELTTSDTHVVQPNHTSPVAGRRDLSDVHRDDHSGRPNTKANNKAAHCHLGKAEGGCLENGANDEQNATDVDSDFATIAVGGGASEDGTEKGGTGSDGCDKFFLVGAEIVTERAPNVDEYGTDDAGVISVQF